MTEYSAYALGLSRVANVAIAAPAAHTPPKHTSTLARFGASPLTPADHAAKRLFDLVFCSLALVVAAPLMALIALAIRLESPGPAIFRQERGGLRGRAFRMFKFRTMRVIEEGEDVRQASRGDARITWFGALLRRSSLDELPQLFNVLRGEMSLVGPRPHALAHDREFASKIEHYALRHQVKAGLTGWAQIQGARGPTETCDCLRRRIDLDLWYLRHWSLRLDLVILLRTLGAVLRGDNAC